MGQCDNSGSQASKQASKQAGSKQAGKQASRQAGQQASRPAGKQASRQAGSSARCYLHATCKLHRPTGCKRQMAIAILHSNQVMQTSDRQTSAPEQWMIQPWANARLRKNTSGQSQPSAITRLGYYNPGQKHCWTITTLNQVQP